MEFSWTIEHFLANQEQCLQKLKEEKTFKLIPNLNYSTPEHFAKSQLVRLRGIIQDQLEPEYYLDKYKVKTSDGLIRIQDGKFQDSFVLKQGESIMEEDCDADRNFGSRRTMFVVSVPGLNSWVQDIERNECSEIPLLMVPPKLSSGKKRNIEDDMEVDAPSKRTGENSKEAPKETPTLSTEYLLNSPLHDRPSKAYMVKIYDDFEAHQLNQVVDIVGFLSLDHESPSIDEDFNEDMLEKIAANPPASLIPRVHAIFVRSTNNINPLLNMELPNNETDSLSLMADLKKVLTQCLFGDQLAAKYLICHLISNVYNRVGLDALGKFTLNISNIPKEALPTFTKEFYVILEMLLPASYYFPMTVENFNTLQFVPKKDYKTNKLTSGMLQLAQNTQVVLDETQLLPGKLEAVGIEAISSLSELIKTQQLNYDFEFYKVPFQTNLPVLILSEGRSLLPSDYLIPLNPEADSVKLIQETMAAGKHFLKAKLSPIRKILTRMRIEEFSMEINDQNMIEQDYVKMRQDRNATVEDLHKLLVFSRLLGKASGETVLSREFWEDAKNSEEERLERIQAVRKQKNEP